MNLTFLAILPIVGGYFYCERSFVKRNQTIREDGHRLYFRSVYHGVFLVTFCSFIHLFLIYYFGAKSGYIDILQYMQSLMNPKTSISLFSEGSISIIFISSFFLGILAPKILNVPYSIARTNIDDLQDFRKVNPLKILGAFIFWLLFKVDWFKELAQKALNWFYLRKLEVLDDIIIKYDFQYLLFEAATTTTPVIFTLDSNKVYVGLVVTSPEPGDENDFTRILPLMSGYREPITREVNFTTNYESIYKEVLGNESELNYLEINKFEVLFPNARIVSVHMFDLKVYKRFLELKKCEKNS
ncbi:MAG: hypothetical protein HWE27_14270 [Gammaproteobacteria bacterium]|nr:hypothetical protein [Gammaproteobacteria bacterium]